MPDEEDLRRKARWYDWNERIFTAGGGGIFFASLADVLGTGSVTATISAVVGVLVGYWISTLK